MSRIKLVGSQGVHPKDSKPLDRNVLSSPIEVTLVLHDQFNSEQHIDIISEFCAEHGLSIKDISLEKRHIQVVGNHRSLESAFDVSFTQHTISHNGKDLHYHSTNQDLSLPAHIAPYISDVLGLHSAPIARPYCYRRSTSDRATATSFTPLQLASIYNFPTGITGAGQSIAIIELGGGYTASDLSAYFSELKISKPPKVVAIGVDGAINNPSDTSGADDEVTLDVEVAGAIAPGATIVVYFAPNTNKGFYDAINAAINNTTYKPNIISISWGGPEASWPSSTLSSFNSLFQTATNKGINVFCAAGDNGSSDGDGSGNHVDFPGSSPYVISCGGTSLVVSGTKITSETVWNDHNGDATGGGISAVFARPTYQSAITFINNKRGVPDVSGDADPNTGYVIYLAGQNVVIGGTSAVAPLWSGLTALINSKLGKSVGYLNPILYGSKTDVCRDITVGSNGAYSAKVGWDCCSGWGSPNGQAILALLTPASTSSNPVSTSTLHNTSGQIQLGETHKLSPAPATPPSSSTSEAGKISL